MNIALFGDHISEIESSVKEAGFTIVQNNPEIVLSYGGDGTFLKSEHAFPEVPKVLIKNSATCRLCTELPLDEVLSRIKYRDYSLFEVIKLKVSASDKEWHAINDAVLHNRDPRRAIRFSLSLNGRAIVNDAIGDGVVIATSLGSTGYFKSITQKTFNSGVGIAYNNTSNRIDPIITEEEGFDVTLQIKRGPGFVYADNQDGEALINDGDEVRVMLSSEKAQVLTFD